MTEELNHKDKGIFMKHTLESGQDHANEIAELLRAVSLAHTSLHSKDLRNKKLRELTNVYIADVADYLNGVDEILK